jgi:hypothetical protein
MCNGHDALDNLHVARTFPRVLPKNDNFTRAIDREQFKVLEIRE